MNNKLILFTTSFPYAGGEQFLETEIKYLSEEFDEIIIIPAKKSLNIRKIPQNVTINNAICDLNKSFVSRIKKIFSPIFFRAISFNMKENIYLFINIIYIIETKKWLEIYIDNNINNTLFYTYWFGSPTTALSLIKKKHDIKFITRVHGGDLYENVHGFNKFPYREQVLQNIDKIFTISSKGKIHLSKKYKVANNKIIISRLGVKSSKTIAKFSSDDTLRIVTCSSMIPVKRLDFLIYSLILLKNKNIKIYWTHIGDGYLRNKLRNIAEKELSDNIEYEFKGSLSNNEVYEFYKLNHVDIFVNCSESEGVPVSIMEAQSFGIPVVATDVGGTSEIVNNENGFLLHGKGTHEELANILHGIYKDKTLLALKREKSLETFNEKYNAENNYKKFSEIIGTL